MVKPPTQHFRPLDLDLWRRAWQTASEELPPGIEAQAIYETTCNAYRRLGGSWTANHIDWRPYDG